MRKLRWVWLLRTTMLVTMDSSSNWLHSVVEDFSDQLAVLGKLRAHPPRRGDILVQQSRCHDLGAMVFHRIDLGAKAHAVENILIAGCRKDLFQAGEFVEEPG